MNALRPFINIKHKVKPGHTIRLYRAQAALPFATAMAALYPKLASTITVGRGYAAFTDDNRLIGIMTSLGLKSIRRNPLLVDDKQLFLRAYLAAMHQDGLVTSSLYSDWDNYGTLRFIRKLGMGAKSSRTGHLSAFSTPETIAYLDEAIKRARAPYNGHRDYAARRLAAFSPEQRAVFSPDPATFGAPVASLDVILL